MTKYFSHSHETFPWHDDCYTWPKLHVELTRGGTDDLTATDVDVHCICDARKRQFWCIGFIGCDRELQINHVIWLAEKKHARVQMFSGLALTDDTVNALIERMTEFDPQEHPGEMVSLVRTNWPTKVQRKVLKKLHESTTPGELLHEGKLAKRLHMPVDEVRFNLEALADLGLVAEG